MVSHPPGATAAPDPQLVPPILAEWLSVFRPCFTAPVWNRILVLVAGAVLAPGKRTVTQVLRVMGLADEPSFRRYHEVLSRACWDGRAVARQLLLHVIERLLPDGDAVIGIDDAIERRWGRAHQGPRHLSRSGPPLQGALRQDQRPALAVADDRGTDPVGGADMGIAVPDDPRSIRALE